MSSQQLPPEGRPPGSAAEAARRLATIVDAAERAAASVIDEAEQQARRLVEEARAEADRIVAARLRELADELESPAAERPPGPPRLRPVEGSGQAGDGPASRRSGSAGARLLATQMAVSGARREEIEARLRSGFEIEDTDEILDAILGPREIG
jgi:cell division septum initiation protein DivIVA